MAGNKHGRLTACFLAQIAEFAFENFDAPPWVLKSFVVALLLGLPIADVPGVMSV